MRKFLQRIVYKFIGAYMDVTIADFGARFPLVFAAPKLF